MINTKNFQLWLVAGVEGWVHIAPKHECPKVNKTYLERQSNRLFAKANHQKNPRWSKLKISAFLVLCNFLIRPTLDPKGPHRGPGKSNKTTDFLVCWIKSRNFGLDHNSQVTYTGPGGGKFQFYGIFHHSFGWVRLAQGHSGHGGQSSGVIISEHVSILRLSWSYRKASKGNCTMLERRQIIGCGQISLVKVRISTELFFFLQLSLIFNFRLRTVGSSSTSWTNPQVLGIKMHHKCTSVATSFWN